MEHYFTNNLNLKSELRTIIYKYNNQEISFYSDNGIFSKDKVDFGSSLLLENILKKDWNKSLSVLDVGCGYGLIGIVLAKLLEFKVAMCDVNKRALHLTQLNCEKNNVKDLCQVFESNVYQNVTDIYDLTITNPPIRAGKDVVYSILDGARDRLKARGELWFVIRKNQGAKSTIEHLEKSMNCEIVEKCKGFYIVKAEKR